MTTVKKPQWPFYAVWIILTGLCVPAALFFFTPIVALVINKITGGYIYVDGVQGIAEDSLGIYFLVPMIGLLIGFVQYGLLRRFIADIGWWVLATVLSWFPLLLGNALIQFGLVEAPNEPSSIDVNFLLLGLSIGIGQWLVLRGRVSQAGWWIAANVAGWGLFGLIFANVNRWGLEALILGSTSGQFVAWALWLLPGCTTAVTLAIFFNQNLEAELQAV